MSINIHEAKTHFSRVVARAAGGETVVISKAGTPVAQVTRIGAPVAPQRIGFLAGIARIPDDFDEWGTEEIVRLFGADG